MVLKIFYTFCCNVLKTGRVPRHVGIILDGIRRWAKQNGTDNTSSYIKGHDRFGETLGWCFTFGITEVTVFLFSIENFNRSKEEVDAIMDLGYKKFQAMLDDIELWNTRNIRIHVIGQMSLLPEKLRLITSRIMSATKQNNKYRLNIAFAYTGRNEISRAAAVLVDGVKNNDISPEDIDTALVSRTLDAGQVDMIIRTSGTLRLSDFLLWQISNAVLYFSDKLWPEFTIWDLLAAILHFQRHAPPTKEVELISHMQQQFLDKLDCRRSVFPKHCSAMAR